MPEESTAIPFGSLIPVSAPLMVMVGAILPLAPDAYSVTLLPEKLAT